MSILQVDDFYGLTAISLNVYTEEDLQSFIDDNEPIYLNQLLGKELADLLLNDLVNGEPQSERFINIFDEFFLVNGCEQEISEGILNLLRYLIYSDFIKNDDSGHTISGTTYQENEVSGAPNVVTTARKAESRKNRGVRTWEAIRWYINENSEVYPEYAGVKKTVSFLGLI
tara:strand:- start:331 stop:843 length:513 start_codon:yes stop_codon:yes gene_type:complete